MENKRFQIILCCLMVLVLLLGTMPVFAENNDAVKEAQSIIGSIVAQKDNDFFTQNAGISAEWYVIALRQYGWTDFSNYETALLSYLENTQVYSPASRQKYALALLAVGSENEYIQNTLNDSIGEQGIMSWIYGMHLLNNGCVSDIHTLQEVKDMILSLQLTDGGWAVTGATGDVDVTAMAVQALAPSYETDGAVKNALDKALTFLSSQQLTDGDYASYGAGNPESTAQVMIALSALDIDCTKDSRFIKEGKTLFDGIEKYQLPDGSYCHQQDGTSNETATAQVLCAMVSYVRMNNGQSGLYLLDGEVVPDVTATPADTNQSGSYKPWACLAIIGVGGIACLVLFLTKKRNAKNFIAVLLVVALAVTIVCVTDIQSTENYYNSDNITKENAIGTVTMTIRCDTVAGETDSRYIPADGVILKTAEFTIEEGDTVFTILTEAARKYNLQVEYSGTEQMAYISGIQYLYELDFGDLSGWVYHVNGKSPSVGCGEYALKDGDVIEWLYSCELGNDLQ